MPDCQSEPRPLDVEAVTQLSKEMLAIVREHYRRRPVSRATAQQILNASAVVVAMIITAARAAGDEHGAREFFDIALEQQLADDELPETMADLEKALKV